MVADARGAAAAPVLVGRDEELALLAAALADATAGGARCVVVEGAAGIGKTALLRRFRAQAPAAVLLATGEAEEALVDYALADQLLRAAGVERPQVIGGGADLATVGLRLLEAFAEAAGAGAAVVAVDDAQWADAASLRALLFALRRMAEEPLLLVLAVREGTGERIPEGFQKLDGVRRIALGGLTGEQARALAAGAGRALSPLAARRLRDHAGGNPLYLRALLEELPASAWEDGDALHPAPELFARRVLRLLDGATPPTRALVEAAAVLGARTELHAAAVVAGLAAGAAPAAGALPALPDPLAALEEAQRLGLLTSEPPARAIAFDHPLTRAAVYHALGPARHARLHAAAAAQADHPGVALRHRAAAASGPDPVLAAELEGFAQREVLRNAWESASEAYAAAARLSAGGAERERLEVEAADALLGAALVPAARARLGARAAPGAEAGADARLLTTLGYIALQESRLEESERLLALAWERADADAGVRRRIAERRTVLALGRLRPPEALTWARRVAPQVPEGPERELARWPEAIAHAAAGDQRAALAMLDQALTAGETLVSDFGLRAIRGRFRLGADDVAGALEDLRTAAAAESRLGSESMQAGVHAWLAEALHASGAWEAAVLEVERALSILAAADNPITRLEVHRVALACAVARGELPAAEEQLRLLGEAAANPRGAAMLAAGAASLAAARGRPEQVLRELERLRAAGIEQAALAAEPSLVRLRADALIRLERLAEADALLTPHEARAAALEQRSHAVALLRLRGRLEAARGDHAAAERSFAAALDGAEQLPLPYELALARLDRGRFLRRQGRRREGAALLERARDRFAALGAAPALEQCERELAASGLSPARRGDPDRSALTGRERAVAQLAADGLANREIAAELMVSVKTIEVHLSRVFAKLGISARTELPGRL